jgi:hypothetical protein
MGNPAVSMMSLLGLGPQSIAGRRRQNLEGGKTMPATDVDWLSPPKQIGA